MVAGSCGGGASNGVDNGDSYSYLQNSSYGTPSDPYNSWFMETTVVHADNTCDLVYTNIYGQVILKMVLASPDYIISPPVPYSATYYRYDGSRHLILQADPSAFNETQLDTDSTGPNLFTIAATLEGYSDVIGYNSSTGAYQYLKANQGLIHVTYYYQPSDGAVVGEVRRQAVRAGYTSNDVVLRRFSICHAFVYRCDDRVDDIHQPRVDADRLSYSRKHDHAVQTNYTYTLFTQLHSGQFVGNGPAGNFIERKRPRFRRDNVRRLR